MSAIGGRLPLAAADRIAALVRGSGASTQHVAAALAGASVKSAPSPSVGASPAGASSLGCSSSSSQEGQTPATPLDMTAVRAALDTVAAGLSERERLTFEAAAAPLRALAVRFGEGLRSGYRRALVELLRGCVRACVRRLGCRRGLV